jgi:hypothetical protein
MEKTLFEILKAEAVAAHFMKVQEDGLVGVTYEPAIALDDNNNIVLRLGWVVLEKSEPIWFRFFRFFLQ